MDILGVSSFLRTGLTVLVYASPNPSLYNATEQNLWANRYIHIYVRVCAQSLSCVQLFVTPWTVAYQAPLSMELSRQEYWSRLPFPTPGNLPRDWTHVSCISCIVRWILYYCTTWEAIYTHIIFLKDFFQCYKPPSNRLCEGWVPPVVCGHILAPGTVCPSDRRTLAPHCFLNAFAVFVCWQGRMMSFVLCVYTWPPRIRSERSYY